MAAATLHRLMLAGEFGFYLLLGLVLVGRCGWVWQQALGLAMLLMVAGRCFVIGVTFAFSRAYAVPPPTTFRIGTGRAIVMFVREVAAFFALFTVIMPFDRLFMGPDRLVRSEGGRAPLLLIHGYQCNRGFWIELRNRLTRAGWQVATISLDPVFNDIDGYVEQVSRRIEDVCAATGADKVMLVGHSMGGLVSRAYLRRRPITDATELRQVAAGIVRMRPSDAQARALEALGRHYVSDHDIVRMLARLFSETPSSSVQGAIAGILIRADQRSIASPELVRTLVENRRPTASDDSMIDALIGRLQSP